jgi:hypothetical protein
MRLPVTAAGLCLVLGGCAWAQSDSSPPPAPAAAAAPVELRSGGLLLSEAGTAELGLTLLNVSGRTLWVGAHFRTPGGRSDCVLVKELADRSEGRYFCPQPAVQADTDYPIQITVFGNSAQTEVVARLNTRFRFDPEDVQAVKPAGPSRPAKTRSPAKPG